MNPYEFTDEENAARNAACIARTKMYYLKCTQFLNAVRDILTQLQILDLIATDLNNPFLAGKTWNIKTQKNIFDKRISTAGRLVRELSIMALECNELVSDDYFSPLSSKGFVLTFVDNPSKLEFFEEELRLDYYGKAEVKFFDIENRWQPK